MYLLSCYSFIYAYTIRLCTYIDADTSVRHRGEPLSNNLSAHLESKRSSWTVIHTPTHASMHVYPGKQTYMDRYVGRENSKQMICQAMDMDMNLTMC